MGVVFSCLAGTFMITGHFLENVCLALGEILSVLIRVIFAVFVGLFDILAAISCCWRVPFENRPDRDAYTYSTTTKNLGGRRVFHSYFTAEGQAERAQQKASKQQEAAARVEQRFRAQEAEAGKAPAQEKPSAAPAPPGNKRAILPKESAALAKQQKKADAAAKKATAAAAKADATAKAKKTSA